MRKLRFHPFTLALALCLGFVALAGPALAFGPVDEAGVMLRDLRSPFVGVRNEVINYFMKYPDERAVEPFIAAKAAYAFTKMPDPRATDMLIGLLKEPGKDHSIESRIAAVTALKAIGDPRAVPALIEMVNLPKGSNYENYPLHRAAIEALGSFQDERAVPPLLALVLAHRPFGYYTDIPVGEARRRDAIEALVKIGPVAEHQLLDALNNAKEDSERSDLIRILGEIGDKRCVPALLGFLKDGSQYVKTSAIEALGETKDPRALEALLALDTEKEKWLLCDQIIALSYFTDPRAFDLLITSLEEEDAGVRTRAIISLGNIGNRQAVPHIIARLSDKGTDTVIVSIQSLEKLRDPRAVEPLIGMLSSDDQYVIFTTINALGNLRDQRAIDPLIAFAKKSKDAENRLKAIMALARMPAEKPERIVDALEEIVKSDAPLRVRASAAQALGEICTDDPQRIAKILILLQAEDFTTHGSLMEAAMLSLARLGTPVVPTLLEALKDPNPRIRYGVARVFQYLPDERAVQPLLALLKDEDKIVRSSALNALAQGRFRNVPVEPLTDLLGDKDSWMRNWAMRAIAAHPDPEAVDDVSAMLLNKDEDQTLRATAAETLWRIGDSRAINPLIQALAEKDSPIKRQAARALYGLTGEDFGEDAAGWQAWWDKQEKK